MKRSSFRDLRIARRPPPAHYSVGLGVEYRRWLLGGSGQRIPALPAPRVQITYFVSQHFGDDRLPATSLPAKCET